MVKRVLQRSTYLINPRTNRRIRRGGATHMKLIISLENSKGKQRMKKRVSQRSIVRKKGGSSIFSFKRRTTRKPRKRVGFKLV